jgi:hypothetical protein
MLKKKPEHECRKVPTPHTVARDSGKSDACSFSNDRPFPIFDILLPDLKVDRRIFDRQVTSLTQMSRAT